MEYICAPWRSEYFSQKKDGCPFCRAINSHKIDSKFDDELGVLFRAEHCFGIMNLFPYSPGAFMVIPYKHTDNIESLDEKTWQEMSFFVRHGVGILKKKLGANGVNIGMNLGVAAGAGIAEHIHYHLVPRWERDTNFITTIANVRVNGVPFYNLFKSLKEGFCDIKFKNNF